MSDHKTTYDKVFELMGRKPLKLRLTATKGTLKGNHPTAAMSYIFDSETRKAILMGEGWNTFSDDPNPFPEFLRTAALVEHSVNHFDALLRALRMHQKDGECYCTTLAEGGKGEACAWCMGKEILKHASVMEVPVL